MRLPLLARPTLQPQARRAIIAVRDLREGALIQRDIADPANFSAGTDSLIQFWLRRGRLPGHLTVWNLNSMYLTGCSPLDPFDVFPAAMAGNDNAVVRQVTNRLTISAFTIFGIAE